MHEVLVNRLGGLSLPRKSVVRLTDRLDMTLDVYRGRKTTMQCNNGVQTDMPMCDQMFKMFLRILSLNFQDLFITYVKINIFLPCEVKSW